MAVLCYHGVRPLEQPLEYFSSLHIPASQFERHCRLLRAICNPIALADWRAALAGGPPLPPRPVLVTFDDGYRSVYTLARPILERFQIPAAVFICSEPVATGGLFWFDALARRNGEAEVTRAKGLTVEALRTLIRDIPRAVDAQDPQAPLRHSEVTALARQPQFEVGSHTPEHLILARATVAEQATALASDRAQLEQWCGQPVRAFAYPNGRPSEDYTAATVRLVAQAGFDVAFTTRGKFATPDEAPLERSRFVVLADLSAAELAHRLAYSWAR